MKLTEYDLLLMFGEDWQEYVMNFEDEEDDNGYLVD